MRETIKLCENWRFSKTRQLPAVLPEEWEVVTLPHTWNAVDGQDGGNDYWRGTAMYCRTFPCPELEREGRAILEFSGAAMIADVYVNGEHLAHHEGGYSTFRTDITDVLKEENLLCVAVDNAENDRVYPQKADFTFYGGLYREVRLITVPKLHFDLCCHGAPGIKVTPAVEPEKKRALVTVETWQTGDGPVVLRVDGMTQTVESVEGHATATFVIENVRLWDGPEDPWLYEAVAELPSGDLVSARFGCRSFQITSEGFFLNGRSYPLRGVSRHQDRWEKGCALTMEHHREDIGILRELGANAVRLAHYQHAQEFYDLCDQYGIIVWAEIPYITAHMTGGRDNTLSQMKELVLQCYNHPSIVCWGLSNEISAASEVNEELLENHRSLNELCRRLDPSRPTVIAHPFMLETDSPLIPIADLAGYNLYFGWYLGELNQNEAFFDEYRAKYPDRCIGFSEYGADANLQYQSAAPEKGDYSEQYQCVYHEHILKLIQERPWIWCSFVWNGFDFAADGRDEGGKNGQNQKGLVTFDRKQKKDAFYLYKAAWNQKEPFVHLCGSRYVNRAEEMTQVKVYSNQPDVSLYVDGRFFETRKGKTVFTFQVPVTGEHTVEAIAGDCRDEITFRKVAEPDPAYRMSQTGEVVNWFDTGDFKPSYFSIKDTFGALMAHPRTAPLVQAVMSKAIASRGDVAKSANQNAGLQKMMAGMSFQSLLKQAGDAVSAEEIERLNAQLQTIKKDELPTRM